jgi:hypothetical protein
VVYLKWLTLSLWGVLDLHHDHFKHARTYISCLVWFILVFFYS